MIDLTSGLAYGLVGGLVATVAMTVVMNVIGDGSPPPTANLVATLAGGDPEEYRKPGLALHLLYGVVAGGILGVGASTAVLSLTSPALAVGVGLAYGIALMVGGLLVWMRLVLGVTPDPTRLRTFGVVHAVYGLVLGGVVAVGLVA